MRYTISDLSYKTAKDALEANGFALDETLDANNVPLTAEIWTTKNHHGIMYGFVCGRLVRDSFHIGQTFSLHVEDSFLRDDLANAKERFIEVIRALLFRTSIR
jgi:hypothetical protein